MIRKRVFVALSGSAGCGKSTIADLLAKYYGFRKLSFARRLKEICYELYPHLVEKPKEEQRGTLQKFGDYTRSIYLNCWRDVVLRTLKGLIRADLILSDFTRYQPMCVVIDDMRFKNEYDALKAAEFKLVRINRDKELRRKWGYNVDDEHKSEHELDEMSFDLVIRNDYEFPFKEALFALAKFLGLEE